MAARLTTALLLSLAISALTIQPAGANYPHLPEFGVDCVPCHFGSGGTYPNDTDCLTCHDGTAALPVVGHSSATTSDKYGTWSMSCTTCHDGMYQWQFWDYGAESYITSGTSDPGGITETTLTMTGAGWSPDEFAGYQLIPNMIADGTYSYRIVGNTSDTITVEGPIYLPVVTDGNTSFAVIYGRLVQTVIDTPNSGSKPVKFFDNTGTNSFADGDTTFDGVCEVCHTQTNHHRNDGNAPGDFDATGSFIGHNDASNCTDCHIHSEGFRASCDACHDYPPTSGSHSPHLFELTADFYEIGCDTCHFEAPHESGTAEIAEGDLFMKYSHQPMSYTNGLCSDGCHTGAIWGGDPLLCYDCHSNNMSFVGDPPPPQPAPTLIPQPDLVSLTDLVVTLEWLDTPPAYGPESYTEYRVEVDEDSAYGSLFKQTSGWITDTSWSLTLDTAASWVWTVTARDAARPKVESDATEDAFTITSPGAPSVPVLVPEPDFNTGRATPITVTWFAATDPEGDPVEYFVEVARNPYFEDLSHVSGWISATQYSFTSTGCEALYWRVRSRDAANDALSPWSSFDFFQDLFSCGGSCPFLYVWDGSTFAFETDLNGPGMLAMRSANGVWKPNPNEYYVLQTDPVASNGKLEMRLVEERYEVNYLDQFRFFAVDLPADRELYSEKPSFTTPYDGFEQHVHTASRHPDAPLSVVHVNTGEDVSEVTADSDQDYLVLNEDRNLGFGYQTLELDLGDLSEAPQIKLIIDALSAFPTTPEGTARLLDFGPRTRIEVPGANGEWVGVPSETAELPMPPEFRRPFILDVTDIFVTDEYKLRLTFLFKTYVDSIRFDTTADDPVSFSELPLSRAKLRSYGYSEKSSLIDDLFEFVYRLTGRTNEHDYYPGDYTRYGTITRLLDDVDDQFVIYGSGDEIALRFEAPAPPPAGLARRFFVYSNGYYKVARNGVPATVEPLPFAAMSNFPYDEAVEQYPDTPENVLYQRTFNTRTEP